MRRNVVNFVFHIIKFCSRGNVDAVRGYVIDIDGNESRQFVQYEILIEESVNANNNVSLLRFLAFIVRLLFASQV